MVKGELKKFETLHGKFTHGKEVYYNGVQGLTTRESEYEITEEVIEGMTRSMNDIIFFAEHFFYIINNTKRETIKLRKYQIKFLKTMAENNRVILLTARQIGKTTLMTIYALWLALFHDNQEIVILANKKETANMILDRISFAYQEMPGWLKPAVKEFNKTSIQFINNSRIKTSATTANSIRGNSVSCLILDEFAFVDEAKAAPFMASVMPTLSANPDAKLFVCSTPNGTANQFYELVRRAQNNSSEYKVESVTWKDVPGRDLKWKKRTIETDCNGDVDQFAQEYECKFLGASKSPFRPIVFTRLKEQVSDPIKTDFDGELCIYKMPQNYRVYTIGVDVGEGVGLDASVINVLDITDLSNIEQVAMYYSNLISVRDFANRILYVAKLYGNPNLAIERNGCGQEVCNRIYYDENYPHFVNWGTANESSRENRNFRPGIISFQNTRTPAIVNLKYYLQDMAAMVIHDPRFLTELEHFERKENNVWKAEKGHHDDVIMSMTWALYSLHRNLVNKYYIVQGLNQQKYPKAVKNNFTSYIDINKADAEKEGRELLSSNLPHGMTGSYGVCVMSNDRLFKHELISPNYEEKKSSTVKPQRDLDMEAMFRNFAINGSGWRPLDLS